MGAVWSGSSSVCHSTTPMMENLTETVSHIRNTSSGFVIKGYQERQNSSSIIVFLVVLLIFIIITLSILISIMLNSYMLSREQREYKRYVKASRLKAVSLAALLSKCKCNKLKST